MERLCGQGFQVSAEPLILSNASVDEVLARLATTHATLLVAEPVDIAQAPVDLQRWCLQDLVFEDGASLTLGNRSLEIAVAGRLVVTTPQQTIFRSFDTLSPPDGDDGESGRPGSNSGKGRDGGHGSSGEDGQPGSDGQRGPRLVLHLKHLPPLPWSADLRGQDGGDGGDGGNGGDGGSGGRGRNAATSIFGCKKGAGDGGDGGNGGRGGSPGLGGACGPGGELIVETRPELVRELGARIHFPSTESKMGAAGKPGLGGRPGRPGPGGAGQGFCSDGRPGRHGVPGDSGTVLEDKRPATCPGATLEIRSDEDD